LAVSLQWRSKFLIPQFSIVACWNKEESMVVLLNTEKQGEFAMYYK
jgi:hypothetical protein